MVNIAKVFVLSADSVFLRHEYGIRLITIAITYV